LTARTFLLHGERLLRTVPAPRLVLSNIGPYLDAILACPHLERARGLTLCVGTEFGDAEAVRLAGCPHLANLTRLDFFGVTSLGDAGARALAEAHVLARLTRLFVYRALRLSPAGIEALRQRFGEGFDIYAR
jgi:hypothetical protein